MLSPPKPLDKIQPNLMCELLTCMWREFIVCILTTTLPLGFFVVILSMIVKFP